MRENKQAKQRKQRKKSLANLQLFQGQIEVKQGSKMGEGDPPMWMENLDEWILDSNRVVTPRLLSRHLKMHVNTAKECLYHYSRAKRVAQVDLTVILLMSGRDREDQALVKLVREEGAAKAEKKLFYKLYSKHVYAIGKSKALKSQHLLAAALLDEVKETGSSGAACGAITNRHAVPRSDQVKLARPKLEEPKKALPPPKNNKKEEVKIKDEAPKAEIKKDVAPAIKKGGQKGIAGMFAKAAANPRKKVEVKTEVKKEKDSPGKENRENEEKEKEEKKTKASSSKKKSQPKRRRIKMLADSDSDEAEKDEEEEKEEEGEPVIDEPAPPQVHRISSSEEEDDEVIPATPVEIKKTSNNLGINNKRRRRRVRRKVEKTYEDEEGFTVTKTEFESASESCEDEGEEDNAKDSKKPSVLKTKNKDDNKAADNENDDDKLEEHESAVKAPAAKKAKKSPVKNAKKPPSKAISGGAKQASIMTFFKKK